jgi:microcystin-dependent protein
MSDSYLAEIRCFPYNNIPKGWHLCDGSILQVSQYQALFALLGKLYGGDGRTTFALPDLRGRVPLQVSSTDSSCNIQGQIGGMDSVTLVTDQIPAHSHSVAAFSTVGNTPTPASGFPSAVLAQGTPAVAPPIYGTATTSTVALIPASLQATGGSQPHENRQPTMALNWCICISGFYPSRN